MPQLVEVLYVWADMKKVLKIIAIILLVLILGAAIAMAIMHISEPEGNPGSEADQIAREIQSAVNIHAWEAIPYISWTFAGRHDYIWNKKDQLASVSWGENTVLINTKTQEYRAYKNDQPCTDGCDAMREKAWEYWCNDSYWLNPIAKFFDPGVTRSIVSMDDGKEGLKITHNTGGVTPGDSYVWLYDEKYLPYEWQMWVKIIPVGGTKTSWGDWQEYQGAKIATSHSLAGKPVELISDVSVGKTLEAIGAEAQLFEELWQ